MQNVKKVLSTDNMKKQSGGRRVTNMEFYASPIIPGVDLIHAEFMDRNRMRHLCKLSDLLIAAKIEAHLAKHNWESTKKRMAQIKKQLSEVQ